MKELIEHITGKRLMERWILDEHELFQITQKGLLAYKFSDVWEIDRMKSEYSGIGIDISGFDFKPDYIDKSGNIFRCVFPDKPEEIPSLIFKLADIKLWEALFISELKPIPERTLEVKSTAEQDFENFIRNLKVFYENDHKIKIQIPGRKADCFTCESLGFRDKETKTWKDLTNVLQSRPPTYDVGAAYKYLFYDSKSSHEVLYGESEEENTKSYRDILKTKDLRVKAYDRKRKRLLEINKKLINFFHKQYSIEFPTNYKLYEPCEDDGVYKFKFNVMLDDGTIGYYKSRYESYPKDKLLGELKILTQNYRNKESDNLFEQITEAARIALDKKWLSKDEILDMFKG